MDEESPATLSLKQIKCQEVITDTSIDIRFAINKKPELTIKSKFDQINVKGIWFGGNIGAYLKRNGKAVTGQKIYGLYDSSDNQTDMVLTKDNSDIVKQAQVGDTIKLDAGATVLNLKMELLNENDEVIPYFNYKCPRDNSHQLKVLYSDYDEDTYESKLNEEYLALIAGKEDQTECYECDKDLGHKESRRPSQYFCFDCNQSFCGKCAFKVRQLN